MNDLGPSGVTNDTVMQQGKVAPRLLPEDPVPLRLTAERAVAEERASRLLIVTGFWRRHH